MRAAHSDQTIPTLFVGQWPASLIVRHDRTEVEGGISTLRDTSESASPLLLSHHSSRTLSSYCSRRIMHYPASASSSSNRGSSSSAWSHHTSSSSVSLPRTPTIGVSTLPPSPATPSNNFNCGGVQPMAPRMGTVSLPTPGPSTPGYHTSALSFLRVKTRRMLTPDQAVWQRLRKARQM